MRASVRSNKRQGGASRADTSLLRPSSSSSLWPWAASSCDAQHTHTRTCTARSPVRSTGRACLAHGTRAGRLRCESEAESERAAILCQKEPPFCVRKSTTASEERHSASESPLCIRSATLRQRRHSASEDRHSAPERHSASERAPFCVRKSANLRQKERHSASERAPLSEERHSASDAPLCIRSATLRQRRHSAPEERHSASE